MNYYLKPSENMGINGVKYKMKYLIRIQNNVKLDGRYLKM